MSTTYKNKDKTRKGGHVYRQSMIASIKEGKIIFAR